MSVANPISGDITPLAMLFSRSHRHYLTFPHTHTRGQQYEDHPGQYCLSLSLFFFDIHFPLQNLCFDHDYGD